MSKTPLVSIVLPVHNAETTLSASIRSILHQSYTNWEMIVIDDGSSDNSLDLASGFSDSRIRVIADGKNLKLPARLNQGIAMCRGEYFARMDADDIAYPERLQAQVAFLQAHPDIDLVGSRVLIFDGAGRVVGTYPFRATHEQICRRPTAGFYLPHPTWMGKIAWFRAHPYDRTISKAQDQELLLRTHNQSRFACISNILLGYRKADLSLRTIFTGRSLYTKMLLLKAVRERRFFLLFGAVEQAIKFATEIFAVSSGLNYRVLQHRALPVSGPEIEKWKKVWNACNRNSRGSKVADH